MYVCMNVNELNIRKLGTIPKMCPLHPQMLTGLLWRLESYDFLNRRLGGVIFKVHTSLQILINKKEK